ncbi:DNA polymerase III subunit delta [Candidatus Laterigemmans baculatus]|uniref:DNA polymerase III subunit delta n=1 Tax=Candidatus Laterigemmans baculatus TaxID=2770505 RepID=UPI0013DBDEA5|nr:DNA polymerase III subunit delta [Candidatus Laterigemmans baculatus]
MPVEAFDLLAAPPDEATLPPVVVLFGEDATLRGWVLRELTRHGDAETVDGESAVWRDVRDEVSTASLFDAGERRVLIVRGADPLVKKFRPELEDYVARPSTAGRLFLEVQSFPSNTRLYKSADKEHLVVHCAVPTGSGKSKRPDLTKLRKFLTSTVAPRHQCRLTGAAADLLVDLVGTDIGMLDTETAKLALYAEVGGEISDVMVRDIVGGWRAHTTWETIDAAAAGNAAEALRQLDRMLASGEQPIALLPQIAWSMRRLGLATAAIDHAERTGRRMPMATALQAAGYRPFELKKVEGQLRLLGRERGRKILGWLLEADLKLKGTHSTTGPDRLVLEEFFLKLAKG